MNDVRSHVRDYLDETRLISKSIGCTDIERMVDELVALRLRWGRLYTAGLGGSAANASHAANDFRKLCGIEAHCLTDNVASVTARANDLGWQWCLDLDYAGQRDALLVLSVGGGADGVSTPLVEAAVGIKRVGGTLLGIVGRDGGHVKKYADACVIVPTVSEIRVTPHTEGWQMVILHCLVSHPRLQIAQTKW